MRSREAEVHVRPAADRIEAMTLAYREWATAEPVDFQLIYGNPIPGYIAPVEVTAPLALAAFLGMFRWYMRAWSAGELRVPPEYAEPPSAIQSALPRNCSKTAAAVPPRSQRSWPAVGRASTGW